MRQRSFATISSGLCLFLGIVVLLGSKAIPQGGPLQWGRIIVSKRAELFGTIELASEIDALKAQLAALGSAPRPPSPIRRPFAIT